MLSSDHHRALVMARKACKTDCLDEASLSEVWAEIENYFHKELVPHFRIEEQYIASAFVFQRNEVLVQRLHAEHLMLGNFFKPDCCRGEAQLKQFGKLLKNHVRFEEQELFTEAEKCMTSAELTLLLQACGQ